VRDDVKDEEDPKDGDADEEEVKGEDKDEGKDDPVPRSADSPMILRKIRSSLSESPFIWGTVSLTELT
jgi:hypothetical protein